MGVRMPVLKNYLIVPFRLLLGTGPLGLHQVQIDDWLGNEGAGRLPDVEYVT